MSETTYMWGLELPHRRKRTFDQLARSWWLEITEGGLSSPILIRVEVSAEGTLVCSGLVFGAFGSTEVTARDLRSLRLGELVGDLSTLLTAQKKRKGSAAETFRRVTLGDLLEVAAESVPPPHRRRPGPRGHPREHYEAVALAYRRALITNPAKPMRTLAEAFHTSDATARRWVQRARDMGLLDPDEGSRR